MSGTNLLHASHKHMVSLFYLAASTPTSVLSYSQLGHSDNGVPKSGTPEAPRWLLGRCCMSQPGEQNCPGAASYYRTMSLPQATADLGGSGEQNPQVLRAPRGLATAPENKFAVKCISVPHLEPYSQPAKVGNI